MKGPREYYNYIVMQKMYLRGMQNFATLNLFFLEVGHEVEYALVKFVIYEICIFLL